MRLQEDEGASVTASGSGIDAAAPENQIDELEESMNQSMRERIRERIKRNVTVRRAIREGNTEVIEEDVPERVRYQLQDWENGNQTIDPETNEVKFEEGTSEYEKWRREKVDAGRKARLETEEKDRERSRTWNTSTYESTMNHMNELDGQIDDFLADYIKQKKQMDANTEPLKESR